MGETYCEIGRILKTHGYAGELRIQIEEPYLEDFAGSEVLFIGDPKAPLPYFPEYVKWDAFPMLIKFEDINNKEEASELVAKPCYLPEVDPTENSASIPAGYEYGFVQGFTMKTAEGTTVGIIQRVDEYPQQEMALVNYEGNEILIPLNNTYIVEINREKEEVWMDLPDGILNL